MNQSVFTTGEVAKVAGVNFRTVIRWIDRGELKGYKLPGRGDHRVTKEALLQFLTEHQMPIPIYLGTPEKKALVVDDDVPMAKAIARVLKGDGWNVEIANDGFTAGALLMEFKPLLMTLDLRMAGMDGFEVLRFTRAKEDLSHLKILVISALGIEGLEKAKVMGANEVLEKPFENEHLRSLTGSLVLPEMGK